MCECNRRKGSVRKMDIVPGEVGNGAHVWPLI
jgi:hypothetical protein